jgi:iron complex outermembrane receptor protein
MNQKFPCLLAGVFLLAELPFVHAQGAIPAASAAPKPGETVLLNPFLVTSGGESGYAATNTLDGSRLNTALRDTPASISVFTRDFMNDVNATDLATLLRYDLSSEFEFGDANADGAGLQVGSIDTGTAWRTRGLTGAASTNGFRDAGGANDLYNVERVGSSRGPNAILFGTGASGGVMNLRTKTADPRRNLYSVEFKGGTHDVQRASLDVNRVLIQQKLALRFMAISDHKGSHIPHMYSERLGATLAGQYRFSEHTNLQISFEKTQTTGIGGRPWGISDSITGFLTALNSGLVRFDPVDERYETLNGAIVGGTSGVGNLGVRTAVVYTPDGLSSALWEGASASANRVTLSTTTSQFAGPKPTVPEWVARYNEVNGTGASEYGETDHRNFTAVLNHRWFRNFYMELAYNYAKKNSDSMISQNPELRADLNYRLPGGALNPYFYGNGYYFSQQNYIRLIRQFEDETLRASFSYDLDLKRWGNHRVAVLGERHINDTVRYRLQEVWEGAPYGGLPEAANNRVQRRRYFEVDGPLANWGPGHTPVPFTSDSYNSAFSAIGRLTSGWTPANDRDVKDQLTTDSQLFVMQNYLLQRRLVTTVGVRRDTIDTFAPRTVRDATTRMWRFANASDQSTFDPAGLKWFEDVTETGYRRSFGAVFHLTRNFSLTGNASDGIELPARNRSVLPYERVPDPFKGKGRDYGVNFTFLDNKFSGSVRYFESSTLRENNNGKVDTVFVNPNNDVMASFEHYFRQANITNLGAGAPIGSIDELRVNYFSTADSYMSDRVSNGYEFEMVANPTRNWSIRMGYANTDRTRTKVLTEGEPWWAERLVLWKALDQIYTSRTGSPSVFTQTLIDRNDAVTNRTVNERIADSDRELAGVRLEEEQGYGNRRHKANLWTRYAFTTGALKGAAVGGGYRYQSKNVAGFDVASSRVLFGNPRSLFDLFLQYRTKGVLGRYLDRTSVTYQVNVSNLLNDQTILVTKAMVDTATRAPYVRRAFREDPRSTTFTLRVDF